MRLDGRQHRKSADREGEECYEITAAFYLNFVLNNS